MKEYIVRSEENEPPRFRNSEGQKWWNGDTITEEDLLGIYRADHIEVLVESGALEPVPAPKTAAKK